MMSSINKPRFLAVDLYCGAGGTTRGLIDAGGYVIAGVDKDEGCRETYESNNENTTIDQLGPTYLCYDMFPSTYDHPEGQQHIIADALELRISKYRLAMPDVPLLFTVCAPCQAFTKFVQRNLTVSRSQGRERDRQLISQSLPLIRRFGPDLVMTENVAGIRRGRHAPVWESFKDELRELGYLISEGVVCASRFGVPQRRRRSVLLAARQSFGVEFPTSSSQEVRTVSDAIGHLQPLPPGGASESDSNHRCRRVSELNQRRLMSVEPGGSNRGFADTEYGDLTLPCHRRMESRGNRGFADAYTRMHPDQPAPTITTRFCSVSNGRFGHYDPVQARGLSLREGAILQGFPEPYTFYGSSMEVNARMIGNAVPPPLAQFFADWSVADWERQRGRPDLHRQWETRR